MPCLALHFADAYDAFSNGEITFLKFLTIAVMFLWIIYLSKEVFFHRPDPTVSLLVKSVTDMTSTVSATTARIEALERRQLELGTQQRADTQEVFREMKDMNASIQQVLREHEHDIAKGNAKPR